VELHPLVRIEWRDDHWLSRRSLIWIREHADPNDVHPIASAVRQLRLDAQEPPTS
jgi:hypothetical protein